jgi:hypothetical protein
MTEFPTFDDFVDVLRQRLAAADALKPSELHDFHELMSDYDGKVGTTGTRTPSMSSKRRDI